jgi:hypothetical protein
MTGLIVEAQPVIDKKKTKNKIAPSLSDDEKRFLDLLAEIGVNFLFDEKKSSRLCKDINERPE